MISVVFSVEDLHYFSDSESWTFIVDEFLISLQDIVVSRLSSMYSIPISQCRLLVKIRNYDYTRFEVGIIESNHLSISLKKVVLNVLQQELGSMVNGIPSTTSLVMFTRTLSDVIPAMWMDFLTTWINRSYDT